MKKEISILEHRCPQNHPCPAVRVCPQNAIVQNGYAAPQIDKSRCTSCGLCVNYCPFGAFQQ